jgi:hypothetical protein
MTPTTVHAPLVPVQVAFTEDDDSATWAITSENVGYEVHPPMLVHAPPGAVTPPLYIVTVAATTLPVLGGVMASNGVVPVPVA